MSSNYVYHQAPSKTVSQTLTTNSVEVNKKKFILSPTIIWVTTIIILIIILIITILLVRNKTVSQPEIDELAAPTVLDLGSLIDLAIVGQCCIPPSQSNTILTYIYDPVTNYTYSFNPTSPSIVCQNEVGSNKQTCLNFVSDSAGEAKILAHYGIKYYYAFATGNVVANCTSFSLPCPPFET